jgi:hypothetical protein
MYSMVMHLQVIKTHNTGPRCNNADTMPKPVTLLLAGDQLSDHPHLRYQHSGV